MADEEVPPVETIPFDPIFDTAIRLKCPGINQRNTFRVNPPMVVCGNGFSGPTITSFTKNYNRCWKRYPTASEAISKRICKPYRFTNVVTNNLKHFSSYSCKISGEESATRQVKRGNRCQVVFTSAPEQFQAITCRLKSKVTQIGPNEAKRICRNVHPVEEFIRMMRARHLCITSDVVTTDGRWGCKTLVYAKVEENVIRVLTNLGRCRVPSLLDVSEWVMTKICVRVHALDNIIDTNGAKAPRAGGFTCKIYPAFEQDTNGRKICNTIKTIPLTDNFKFVGTEGRFSCRTYPPMDFSGRRFRCGTLVLTTVDLREFGRIWGGRPSTNFIIRESGRMIGKFR